MCIPAGLPAFSHGPWQCARPGPGIVAGHLSRTCGVQTGTEFNDSANLIHRVDLLTRQQVGSSVITTFDHTVERPLNDQEVNGNCRDAEAAVTAAIGREPIEEDECSEDRIEVTYVSPAHISFTGHHSTTEFCSPDKYYYDHFRQVMKHDGASEEFLPLLSESAAVRVTEEWRKRAGECTTLEQPTDWNIVRMASRWEARLQIVNTRLCIGSEPLDMAYTGRVPAAVARPDSLGKLRPAVAKRHASLRDTFVSPGRDRVAVLNEDSRLFLYEVRADRLGKLISTTRIPKSSGVIMVEWTASVPASEFRSSK